jgi:hypothetical protein
MPSRSRTSSPTFAPASSPFASVRRSLSPSALADVARVGRKIISQEEMDYDLAQQRKREREQLNSRRLENIETLRKARELSRRQRQQREDEVMRMAAEKEEKLLRRELEERQRHLEAVDRIAQLGRASPAERPTRAEIPKTLQGMLPTIDRSPRSQPSAQSWDPIGLVHRPSARTASAEEQRRWEYRFLVQAKQAEEEDRRRKLKEKREHVDALVRKQRQSLEHYRGARRKELQQREEEFLRDRSHQTLAMEKNREELIEYAAKVRQREADARVYAEAVRRKEAQERAAHVVDGKLREMEELQRVVREEHEERLEKSGVEREAHRRFVEAQEVLRLKRYYEEQDTRRVQHLQVELRRRAEAERNAERAEMRQRSVVFHHIQAENLRRFRDLRRMQMERRMKDLDAFYEASTTLKKTAVPHLDHHGQALRHSQMPPHPELSGLDFERKAFISEIEHQIDSQDQRTSKLAKDMKW